MRLFSIKCSWVLLMKFTDNKIRKLELRKRKQQNYFGFNLKLQLKYLNKIQFDLQRLHRLCVLMFVYASSRMILHNQSDKLWKMIDKSTFRQLCSQFVKQEVC